MKHNGKKVSPMEYVGSKMANAMSHFAHVLPPAEAKQARQLQEQWDRISTMGFRLNNPIVMAELDKQLEEELSSTH